MGSEVYTLFTIIRIITTIISIIYWIDDTAWWLKTSSLESDCLNIHTSCLSLEELLNFSDSRFFTCKVGLIRVTTLHGTFERIKVENYVNTLNTALHILSTLKIRATFECLFCVRHYTRVSQS